MRYLTKQIVFQEIPDEISLSYLITGCPLRCIGCHSSDSWQKEAGHELSLNHLKTELLRYHGWISCVLFMGGEWHDTELNSYLDLVLAHGLKTALYTGLETLPSELCKKLDYIKYGPYRHMLGGINSPTTNQYLINNRTKEIIKGRLNQNDKREVNYDSPK